MTRKVGFGREDDGAPLLPPTKKPANTQDRELGANLTKRLIALGLIEAVGVAILVRGILTGNLIPIAIGAAWLILVTVVTLRVVLNFAGLRKRATARTRGNWTLKGDSDR